VNQLCATCQSKTEVNVLVVESPEVGPSTVRKPTGRRWWVSQLEFMKVFLVGAKNTQMLFAPPDACRKLVHRMRQQDAAEEQNQVAAS